MTVADIVSSKRKHDWRGRVERIIRYRLYLPMKRSRQSPEHVARGVMVGMFWAMLPVFGIQMAMVFLTWLSARRLFRWDFSLINGLAWTWVTNVFTLLPAYYLFYVTGQVMLGRFDDITGYDAFFDLFGYLVGAGELQPNISDSWFGGALVKIAFPLSIGSIPWAILSAWLGYYLSLEFVIKYRARRAERTKLARNQA